MVSNGKSKSALRGRLTELMSRLKDLRATAKEATEEAGVVQAEAITVMDSLGVKTFKVPLEGGYAAFGTRVEASTTSFNEPMLRKALGATLWNKVSVRVLDKGKLEEAIAEGVVSAKVVAQAMTVKPNKPYVKITIDKDTNGEH